jgi:hypothetical protein
VIISRIARYDFPTEWPLLDTLIPMVENSFKMNASTETITLRFNSLYTLHLVMKTIVTKSLPAAKHIAQSITPTVFGFVSGILFSHLESYEQVQNEESLNLARIALKCLRRLVVHGYVHCSNAPEAAQFLSGLIAYLPKFMKHPLVSTTSVQKMIVLTGKVFVDLSTERVVDVVLLPCFFDIVQTYWSILEQPEWNVPSQILETVRLQAMKIIKNLTKHRDFHLVNDKDSRTPVAIQLLETKLFTGEFIKRMTELLLSRYMILSKEDLDFWDEDAESFVHDEDLDHWEYHPRQCAEKLFMTLISKHRNSVCPMVIDMLQTVMDSNHDMLLKEVMYGAVASGSHDLYDYVDFDGWLPRLVQESQVVDVVDHRIVKRRIAQLLGRWVGVKCSKQSRRLVYEAIYHLLHSDDLVVQLTAVIQIHSIIDDFDFEKEVFEPFCQPMMQVLIRLVIQVESFDSKSRIMNVVGLIVERMEGMVGTQEWISIVPQLWTESQDQNVFRASVVRLLGSLVHSNFTIELFPLIFPILKESVDTTKVINGNLARSFVFVGRRCGCMDMYHGKGVQCNYGDGRVTSSCHPAITNRNRDVYQSSGCIEMLSLP